MVIVCLLFAMESQAEFKVGLIYFVPSDGTAQSDIDSKITTLMNNTKTAYATMMSGHGYGSKTFSFDSEIHHITGAQTDAYYEEESKWRIWDEVKDAGYDPATKIYVTFVELESELLDGAYCGTGGDWTSTDGGVSTIIAASSCISGSSDTDLKGTDLLVHELGHAFGLRHDYRTLEGVTGDKMVKSACAAEWLDGHPYFNSNLGSSSGSTTITMSTPSISDSEVTVTFTIADDDDLHQAHFFRTTDENYGFDELSLLACESLDGTSDTATFTTSSLTSDDTSLTLRVMDDTGRSTEKKFTVDLSDLSSSDMADNGSDNGGDGGGNVVNNTPILSLSNIAANFGQRGPNAADINGDGVVNIQDLVLAAGAIGKDAAAPSVSSHDLESMPTRVAVQAWLREARRVKLMDPEFQRGILALEQLLVVLTPKESALLPNYPNPFNPETWIPYRLAKPADTSISIYSVSGHLVRMLELGHQPVGIYESRSHAAYWDGKNAVGESVAGGVYFYVLTAGDFTATRKMLIRK